LRSIELAPAPRAGLTRRLPYIILMRDGKLVDVQPVTARVMNGAAEMFAKADFSRYFPANSHGTLVRTGELTCQAGDCQMILGLPEQQ
jgi:hypothetical protein